MNSEQAFSEDTPQAEGSTAEKPFSFDDVIFGPEGERKADAPPRTQEQVAADVKAQETKPVEMAPINTGEPAPIIPTPELKPVEGQTQVDGSTYQAKNDDKRFEYWQSKASKLQNQVNEMQQKMPLIEHLERNPQMMQQPQQAQAPVEQQTEEFPPPPEKPGRPRNFSREAAYTDPASESAAYLDAVEDWRDNMDEYNELKSEYETARVQDYMQQQEMARQQQVQQQQAVAQQQQQTQEVHEYVQGHYGMTANEAGEFINKFSDPNSISMDNLVQLFRIQKGGAAPVTNTHDMPQAPSPVVTSPSPAFQQQQRAQQVAPTMGVVSGQSTAAQPEVPAGQKFMEALIGKHNDNKAF
tara:strand:- start:255 stop:1319 length:1065 start_codon:yes stop_codon:yes gene_type:complete